MSRVRKVSGVIAAIPPVIGASLMAAALPAAASAPNSVSPQPTGLTQSAQLVVPHCTSNFTTVSQTGFWVTDAGGTGYEGFVNLLYDGCTRSVKAQIVPPPTGDPSFDLSATVYDSQGHSTGVSCAATTYNGGCTTGPVNDAGVTHKAVGNVQINQGLGSDTNYYTGFY